MIDEDVLEKADEMIRLFQAELYKLCEKNISPTEVATTYMVAGVLMKTAIELYSPTMDEASILGVLDAVKDTVPAITESVQKEISSVTYH